MRRPPEDVTFGDETEDVLIEVIGGLGVALARSFRLLDEDLKRSTTVHWDRAFQLFRLLV